MVPDQTGDVPSSSTIIPVAGAPVIVPLVGFDSVTVKVSWSSSVMSSIVATVTVCSVTPAVKVSVPVPAVKSVPEVAVPSEVAQSTVTVSVLACHSVAVKVRSSPSSAETSVTVSALAGHTPVPLRRHTTTLSPTGKSFTGSFRPSGTAHSQRNAPLLSRLSSNGNSCPSITSVRISSCGSPSSSTRKLTPPNLVTYIPSTV